GYKFRHNWFHSRTYLSENIFRILAAIILAAKFCKPTLRIENTQKLSPEIFLSTPQQLEEIKNHWTSSIFCSFFAQQ
ncbi:hypothetical protein ACMEP7_004510, partial [Escherichia coli]